MVVDYPANLVYTSVITAHVVKTSRARQALGVLQAYSVQFALKLGWLGVSCQEYQFSAMRYDYSFTRVGFEFH